MTEDELKQVAKDLHEALGLTAFSACNCYGCQEQRALILAALQRAQRAQKLEDRRVTRNVPVDAELSAVQQHAQYQMRANIIIALDAVPGDEEE